MSNSELIIPERTRDIGDFLVGRLIPFRKKRMVGPFAFIDHMGPTEIGPDHYMDVDQHPHIGLSTLTYILEGQIQHEDSIGTSQLISPGSVNWMTAGKGVTHTERTPQDKRNGKTMKVHGYQIWIALPKELEDMEPNFHHIPESELPQWEENGALFTLVAGKGYGKESPLPVYSNLFMVDIRTSLETKLNLKGKLNGEIGICIVDGSVNACGNTIKKGNMMVSKIDNVCDITIAPNSHLLLFGGEPFPEERFIYWNFVSSSKNKIEEAKELWKTKQFPKVKGDSSYVPMP